VSGDGGDEVLSARAGGLDVFCADLEDFFKINGDISELALEEDDDLLNWEVPDVSCMKFFPFFCFAGVKGITDIFVMFAFLITASSP
jgi:hypothetical protein